MDERTLARLVGLVSAGVGLALVIAPAWSVENFGMGERPNLGRFLGVRDLVLAAGLLRAEDPAPWLRARAVSDAADAALLAGGAVYGAFPRDRAFLGFAVAVGSSASSFALSRRFD
jgi:hypothetical protein